MDVEHVLVVDFHVRALHCIHRGFVLAHRPSTPTIHVFTASGTGEPLSARSYELIKQLEGVTTATEAKQSQLFLLHFP